MPVFGRVNGEWVQGDLRARKDGAWTEETDAVFGRLDGAWVQCQPDPAGELLAPANLAAVPTSNEATFTWDDPTMDATPTDVQYRIPEITPVWIEADFGTNLVVWPALAASTAYQFQARYIVRTDGEITATGPTATVFFSTTALEGPGTPAPDPGGTFVPWTPLTGGGVVGGSGCWYEYILQEFNEAGTGGAWADTAVTGSQDGDVEELVLDLEDLGIDCGAVLRFKYREVCNSVPGDYAFGPVFQNICDGDAECGGVEVSDAFLTTVFADAILAMPQLCYRDDLGYSVIEDYVTEDIYGKLPGFASPSFANGEWGVNAATNALAIGSPVVGGGNTGLAVVDETTDFSYTMTVRLNEQPPDDVSGGVRLAAIGSRLFIRAYEEGSGYRIGVVFPKVGGGSFSLQSTTELALDEFNVITVTIDQNGNKLLYINRDLDVTDATVTAANFVDLHPSLILYGSAQATLRTVGAWDRVLTASEVSSLFDGPGVAAYFMGGVRSTTYYDNITKMVFATETTSVVTATMTDNRSNSVGVTDSGVAGYVMGGQDSARKTVIDKLAFAADTTSALAAALGSATVGGAPMFNPGVAGYHAGGLNNTPATTAVIQKLAFPGETLSTLGTGLTNARSQATGFSDRRVAGYVAGAVNSSQTDVDKFAFPSDTRSALTAMPANRRLGYSNIQHGGVAGYLGGSNEDTTVIYKWVFPTDTRSTLAATLDVHFSGAGASEEWSSGAGYYAGGQSPNAVNDIQKLAFTVETTSTIAATLTGTNSGERSQLSGVANNG
jgi:hypothetical protein